MVVELQGLLMCRSSTIIVWVDSCPFLGLITLFWGLGVISTIDEPQGAFTCRSSTLTYSADSSPFRALLLNVLGTQSDFHD